MALDDDIATALDALVSGTYTLDDDAAGGNLVKGPPRPPGTNMPQVAVFVTLTAVVPETPFVDGGARTRIERHFATVTVRSDTNVADAFKKGQALALAIYNALVLNPPSGWIELTANGPNLLLPQGASDDWRWTVNCEGSKEAAP